MSTPTATLTWTRDFIVVDGGLLAAQALQSIEESTARWVVIRRSDTPAHLYAFTVDELLQHPALVAARERGDPLDVPLQRLLDLHEEDSSTPAANPDDPPPIDRSWRPVADAPSVDRYVAVAADGGPIAVGGADVERERRPRSARARPPALPAAVGAAAPLDDARPQADGDDEPAEDEGTAPVRYPSIETDAPPAPGAKLAFTVDLLRKETTHTQGGALAIAGLAPDWKTLELTVVLACPRIRFDGEGRGKVTIRRNAASTPAQIKGRVAAGARPGETITVAATFFDGTRFCGAAARSFTVAAKDALPAAPAAAVAAAPQPERTRGTIVAEPGVRGPDLTVRISTDEDAKNKLTWQVETVRFDGLPPKLRATAKLDSDTRSEATELFAEFAQLERGQHRNRIEGFGDRLWQRAPQMFRDVYWALWDHYRRRLTIQFISDEPYLPWELMRPARADDSEVHPPLALKHAVARWIERWDGYMRNQLPGGAVFTIAPKYATASRRLPRAQTEAQMLIERFGAQRVEGTRGDVTALLQSAPAAPVAVLHFAGHGVFAPGASTESIIKLEDGALAASEVGRPEVRLGKACRTLVFFNACEVGATGSIFGEVGGWGDAFLGRQFGGFIAPLWSVDDEDASVVATELLEGIVERREPIGEVLRAVREKHGDVSPTFYSYLYYGDVTAHLAA